MRLKGDDYLVGALVVTSEESILTVTQNGYGKRTMVSEYRLQKRGGKGVFGIKRSERNGDIIGAMQVYDNDEVILIADSGKMIRMDLTNLRIIGRTTQGVKLINLEEGEKVVAMDTVAVVEGEDDEEELNAE